MIDPIEFFSLSNSSHHFLRSRDVLDLDKGARLTDQLHPGPDILVCIVIIICWSESDACVSVGRSISFLQCSLLGSRQQNQLDIYLTRKKPAVSTQTLLQDIPANQFREPIILIQCFKTSSRQSIGLIPSFEDNKLDSEEGKSSLT